MATILFQAAGAALGGVFGPVGAIIGRAAGALAGNVVDRALINGTRTISGARLSTARIPGADDGTAINRLYGTARIGGTLIWATRFEEDVTVERAGGKASGPKVETFSYFGNLAVGLCEGPIAGVRRVWADGREIDLTQVEMRVYPGTATQMPDPLIEAKQGAGKAPAYRGLAYVVFERLPLDDFGNRIPLLQFEVLRTVGRLEAQVRAVTVIPGSTEHGYSTVPVTEKTGEGSARIMNRHVLSQGTDWAASIDELTAVCPNLESVALVVSWFGTDLRAGECRIVPGVETLGREEESVPWVVSGIARADAHLISTSNGGPAYGGTPNDAGVVAAIADLKARGLKVFLYPFLMMDVPVGNGLPDPHGGAEQAVYPWRGRITCHPGPGQTGSPDRTAAARTAIDGFCGAAAAGDFVVDGTTVTYAGEEDEGYRRLVLHYAHLAAAAGGVDGFIIGSELRGLTQLRDETGAFPFVGKLVDIAAAVRGMLGAETRITYGADWSEYFGYHPQDGSGDVYFHLDPLWASPDIDAVGIDNYMPLSDWRDEDLSADNPDGFLTPDDHAGMMAAVAGGEGFDWYYASDADRRARLRSPITDGLAGKPWVFRYKDIENWWSRRHHERIGGAELAAPTAWTAKMKPIWFTELGCPAIDKGANQPNVFVDPKSSESAAPYFSNRTRADSMQRRFLEAHHDWWCGPAAPDDMVDPAHMFLWTWDARPFPAFPKDLRVWSDGPNWQTGHWLTGRLGAGTLADVIAAILRDHGFVDFDVSEVSGDLPGYVQGEIISARGLLEPLLSVFQVDAVEDGAVLRFRSRARASRPASPRSVLADFDGEPLWVEERGHDSDYAGEAIVGFYNPFLDYEQASARSRRVAASNDRVLRYDLAAVLPEETALIGAEGLLRDHLVSRRSVMLSLPPFDLDVQPGDVISLPDGPEGSFLVSRITDGAARRIEARAVSPAAGIRPPAMSEVPVPDDGAAAAFAPVVMLMDLPRYESGVEAGFARGAVLTRPFRRTALSSSSTLEGYRLRTVFERPARIGTLAHPMMPGVCGRFDRVNAVVVDLAYGGLESRPVAAVLNGENRLAVSCSNGVWEIVGFCHAEEVSAGRWRLTNLLRGLAGSEDAMAAGAVIGARAIVLDAAVKPVGLTADEAGLALNWIVEPLGAAAGAVAPVSFSGGMRAETPLAPVHLRALRMADGDVRFGWVRCGRIDADDWQAVDIPLDEPEERYRLEILSGGTVVRQVETTAAAYLYGAATEMGDFGTAQSGFSIRVRQMGRKVAQGLAATAYVSL
ncbi:glycoside hydrolase/phage tail family protein [Rhizobium sp. LjRoot30]|uniref:baseplate multidomain protein megatron n=1 Tax=Rhizobium sp. LjRoot30 TaxID=3342320 RepID=UPI003ECD26F2